MWTCWIVFQRHQRKECFLYAVILYALCMDHWHKRHFCSPGLTVVLCGSDHLHSIYRARGAGCGIKNDLNFSEMRDVKVMQPTVHKRWKKCEYNVFWIIRLKRTEFATLCWKINEIQHTHWWVQIKYSVKNTFWKTDMIILCWETFYIFFNSIEGKCCIL